MTSTHTTADLAVPQSAHAAISLLLIEHGYQHAIDENGRIDMTGMALTVDRDRDGCGLIYSERMRHALEEGYTQQSDVGYDQGELVSAATAYILTAQKNISDAEQFWPWSITTFKPKNRQRDLERAAALIAAELDRMIAVGAIA